MMCMVRSKLRNGRVARYQRRSRDANVTIALHSCNPVITSERRQLLWTSVTIVSASPGMPPPQTPHSILVVDDEPDITALVAYHLAKEGYRVTTAGTGSDAIAFFG